MMRPLKKYFLFVSFVLSLVSFAPSLQAQTLSDEISGQYNKSAEKAEVTAVDPREAIAGIIKVILTLVGTIFMALIALSGYWLFTARGEEDKVEKANKTIRAALIGLIITLAAYSITAFFGTSAQKTTIRGGMEQEQKGLKWSDIF